MVNSVGSSVAAHPGAVLFDIGRGGGRQINGKPSYTVEQAANELTRTGDRWHDVNGDGVTDVSYQFRKTASPLFAGYGLRGFSQLNPAAEAQARNAMAAWSDVAKVRFSEAPPGGAEEGNIAFSNYTTNEGEREGATAITTKLPSEASQQYLGKNPQMPRFGLVSDVFFDSTDDANREPTPTNGGKKTSLHEVGHALGMSHPHRDLPQGMSYDTATYAQDTVGYSVMSNWDEHHTGQDFNKNGVKHFPSGPMVDDIAAIQKLYGANTDARSTDTTYGFNSNADRDDYRLSHSSDAPVFTIWDGGGVDTMDFSGFSDQQIINMNPGQGSSIGGMKGNVFIAKGVTIENAIGGSGDDVFISNRAQNVMTGNGGKNTFRFLSTKQSTPDRPDRITDFVSGKDKIDLSELHRKSARGDTPSKSTKVQRPVELVPQFTGKRNQAVLSYDPAIKQARLEIDVNGNGNPNFVLLIDSQSPLKPTDIQVAKPTTT
ncbi:hypothetical protein BLL37_30055 [Pseudomonas azotoformans]|uniref:Peptidase metallopeptidase domain-containing protein n=1 Tax=Pseudomonas azotoformans TaxID=47878 RepID=A0A1V2J530_PSEAZ|nr:M10 family metallopeptidase C-terminal domain-containing protein [Pseudomonas azotoformans]OIN45805.1 hypothetical protein BFL39_23050 [Pseudomonas azotoformans]ONH40240.1 hypothetical protein BLL37_30055 [Pseudomonas azotoformans]SDN49422.1 serralysin [Pseudomonas azotoformans]